MTELSRRDQWGSVGEWEAVEGRARQEEGEGKEEKVVRGGQQDKTRGRTQGKSWGREPRGEQGEQDSLLVVVRWLGRGERGVGREDALGDLNWLRRE